MKRYLLRRLLLAVPLLVALATLLFFLVELAPGDSADVFLRPGITLEMQEQIRTNLGLDEPVGTRYVRWMGALLRGDLGYSHSYSAPVTTVLSRVLPNTLLLTGTALVLAFLVGIAVGVVQAARQNSFVDSALNVGVVFFYSLPAFWLGIMLILIFGYGAQTLWDWPVHFPVSGATSMDHDLMGPVARVLDRAWHLVLPAATLVLVLAAGIARYARSGMLETLRQDYVRAARARGLSERQVVWGHALPNSLLPLITVFGLYLPVLFSGAVFVETVFAWPGMGMVMVEAVATRDIPLVLAGSLLFGVLVVFGNLIADALYALADPRVRYE